jgi:hypothetical protein
VPTVSRIGGLRVVVYLNDHVPAHVHVLGPGWAAVVDLRGPSLREAIGCNERDSARALDIVVENRVALIEAWRRIHG